MSASNDVAGTCTGPAVAPRRNRLPSARSDEEQDVGPLRRPRRDIVQQAVAQRGPRAEPGTVTGHPGDLHPFGGPIVVADAGPGEHAGDGAVLDPDGSGPLHAQEGTTGLRADRAGSDTE
ncbi:hypothetical protein [Pseudonocardia acidicola]|uniref:Uncharacterized protein n=1 Tax=Pseudonocardia acidicola TaxID=2724939 RepID=A0ABX1S2V2_9PSEU|nr:hypothetical protein [Pseudonocardia acidicola]NMH95885.1 hypothetical protein [Pseudonocardia acidicola]